MCSRYWAEEERNDLFQNYFDCLRVKCPVCSQEVCFRMNYTREVVALSVHCDGCSNTAVLLFGELVGLPVQKMTREQTGF